jgi:hypothetical protein
MFDLSREGGGYGTILDVQSLPAALIGELTISANSWLFIDNLSKKQLSEFG